MWKKVAVAGVTAAAIVGVGTVAMADSGSSLVAPLAAASSSSPAPSGSSSSAPAPGTSTKAKAKAKAAGLGKRGVHGQIVTRGKNNTFVTHDLIRGKVTSVSATSIVVAAADKTTQTYVVNSTTKVRLRTAGKAADSTISAVKAGDAVLVAGTGTSTLTATHVVDVKK